MLQKRMQKSCAFCNSTDITLRALKKRNFYHCAHCGGFFVDKNCFLSKQEQKERYQKHNNTLQNAGYVRFLSSFLRDVCCVLNDKNFVAKNILDYGSGPTPCMIEFLQILKGKNLLKNANSSILVDALDGTGTAPSTTSSITIDGVVACDYSAIDCNAKILGYDPFFAPDFTSIKNGADLVLCLEVIEHFEEPRLCIKDLCSKVRRGGYLAIGTQFLTPQINFDKWWYKEDLTHVAFYTIDALLHLLKKFNFELVQKSDGFALFYARV